MTLKQKLIFLVLLPHVAIIGLASEAVYEEWSRRQALELLRPITSIAVSGSAVIHELQKERGQTVGLITSQYNPQNRANLEAQRALSDGVMAPFIGLVGDVSDQNLPPKLTTSLSRIVVSLEKVAGHRQRVNNKDMPVGENIGFYTGIIEALIAAISITIERSPSQEITAILLPYLALVEAKEHSGLERAIGAAVLNMASRGEFARPRYEAYLARLVGENLSLKQFRKVASPGQLELFESTVRGPDVDTVVEWRKILKDIPDTVDPKGVAGAEWFKTATGRINLIKQVEDATAAELREKVDLRIDQAESAITNLLVVNTGIVLIFIGIGLVSALPIANRIGVFVTNLKALAGGDNTVSLAEDSRSDDIGDMNRALVVFRDSISAREKEQEERAKADLKAAEEKTHSLRSMADAVEGELHGTVSSLSDDGEALSGRAEELARVSSEVSEGAQAVAAAAEEANASAATFASVIDTLKRSLDNVADKVTQSRMAAKDVSEAASATSKVVSKLESSSAEVEKVVSLISDVAEQTNLLALNATIEAARAGEAGKGFAVVASEVKALANQTQSSVGLITGQMEKMQNTTSEMVEAMSLISHSIEGITNSSETIEEALSEQLKATDEIGSSASQSSQGSQEVSQRIADVTRNLGRVDDVSGELAEFSSSLRQDIGQLEKSIRKIVRTSAPEVDMRAMDRRQNQVAVANDRRTGQRRGG